ncbi:MAG: LysR family transcriptional regulator [Aliidongia sp.]
MFDPALLSSFKMVAETHSFSEAARRLNLRQPTISQHVARLEQEVGRRLFVRDTHSVVLTADGDAMLTHAEIILQAHERARRALRRAELHGRVRLGTSEDFVSSRLPALLRDFTQRHPAVDLELVLALSGRLVELYDAGQLDPCPRQAAFGRRSRPADPARKAGLGRHRAQPAGARPAAAADIVPGTEHQPCCLLCSMRWPAPVAPGASSAPAPA